MKTKDFMKTIILLVVLTFISLIFPVFSAFIYLIWPIPIVFYIVKYGTGEAVPLVALVAVVNGLLVGLVYDIPNGIIMGVYSILSFGLIGFFLGSGIREKFNPFWTMVLTIVAVIISNLAMALSLPYILGFNYQALVTEMRAYLDAAGLFPQYDIILEQFLYLLKTLVPSLLLVTSAIHGILIYYISTWYLRRKGFDLHQYKPFSTWRFPRWWISLALVLLIVARTYLQYSSPGGLSEQARVVIINLMILLFFLIFLQGFAVVVNWLGRRTSNFLLVLVIFALFFFNIFVIYVLIFLGFIDMWFNLRRNQKA